MTHDQDDRLDEAALTIQTENVLVAAPMMKHGLALDRLFECAHAIAHPRRIFEFQSIGVFAHPLAQIS